MIEVEKKTAKEVAIIGGGAAGFFAAINCKENFPHYNVVIYEKSHQVLSKVKVSGGGRCNVTNQNFEIRNLIKNYPRGAKTLKKLFIHFQPQDTIRWFASRGVQLIAEEDGRMFPNTNSSATIVECFLKSCNELGISIKTGHAVEVIQKQEAKTVLTVKGDQIKCDFVIITAGGGPKLSSYQWLSPLKLEIVEPVPSLFTFNLPSENTAELMGVVAPQVEIKIQGEKLSSKGPLLFTHWGFSGPAVLKLSALGARLLHTKSYHFKIQINWLDVASENEVRAILSDHFTNNQKKLISNANPFSNLTHRLWDYLLTRSEIDRGIIVRELSKKLLNKLVNTLYVDIYEVKGKTTFKEEFVTCGGIAISNINIPEMSLKSDPNIFFAGEME